MIRVIIPARGGSKRILGKNLLKIGDKTLVENAVEIAKNITDEVWVSTDNTEIAHASYKSKAKVHYRKPELATDFSPTIDTVNNFLDEYPDTSILVLIQCTSPYIDPKDIIRGIECINTGNYNSCLSVYEERSFYWKKKDNKGYPLYDSDSKPRTQDMDPYYRETGAFYIFKTSNYDKTQLLPDPVCLVNTKLENSFEIDDNNDYNFIKKIR